MNQHPETPNHALQRTAPHVTAAASSLRLAATMQPPRSLSLGSLGKNMRILDTTLVCMGFAATSLAEDERGYSQTIQEDGTTKIEVSLKMRKFDRHMMDMAFSRGLFTGWMHGVGRQRLVHGRYAKKRGAFLGVVGRT
jgi:hypothetical protein